ncbi:MAG: DUF4112 domain-containing protein [Nitrospirae bacterium]|nr:DUF4112 domain-containing protein [Nitrospirota bacterium]
MDSVRAKERQAERFAHLLDDAFRLGNTGFRFGLDPLVGLVPVIGDALATASGAIILVIARQLRVPVIVLIRMAYNLLLNGLLGAVPFFGDAYSFWFKSHAKNAALLVRAVARGDEGECDIVASSLTIFDVGLVLLMTAPIVVLVGYVSLWLWESDVSFLSFLF